MIAEDADDAIGGQQQSSLRQGDAECRGVQRQEKIKNGVAGQCQGQCERGVARGPVCILRIHERPYLRALRAEVANGSSSGERQSWQRQYGKTSITAKTSLQASVLNET
jgi:hypothetical protein